MSGNGKSLMTAAVAFAIAVSFATLGRAEDKPESIRISTGAGSPFGKPYSGSATGLLAARGLLEEEFKDDGIKIEWFHLVGGGPATNEALASKAVDFGGAGDFPAVFGRAGGLKAHLIGAGYRGNNGYLIVRTDSTIATVKDLKGKRLGMQKGQPWEFGFDNLLRSQGLKQSDLSVLNLNFPDVVSALQRGELDATYATSGGFALIDQGIGKVIWTTREGDPQWLYVADWFVNDDFAKRYPTTVKRFAKAFVRLARWASDEANREEVFKTWALSGYPYANYEREFADTEMKFRMSPIPDEYEIEHYRQIADYMYQNKLIHKKVTIDDWVDRSYVDAAIKELDLQGYWPEYDKDGKPKPGPKS